MKTSNLTVAFVGCGNMGTALLLGLLDAIYPEGSNEATSNTISSFIACTATEKSAARLKTELERHAPRVEVLHGQTVKTIQDADVVVLGFKPYMAEQILQSAGIKEAVGNKLVISLLAGLGPATIRNMIVGDSSTAGPFVARAMPTLVVRYRQSITILEQPSADTPPEAFGTVEWLFNQVGTTKVLTESQFNTGTALTTACLSTISVCFDGLLDGAVVEGLRRQDAMDIATQGIAGFATMLANGMHPAILRESMSSPRGCTIQTLMTVEKASTRAVFAQALIDGVERLRILGAEGKDSKK